MYSFPGGTLHSSRCPQTKRYKNKGGPKHSHTTEKGQKSCCIFKKLLHVALLNAAISHLRDVWLGCSWKVSGWRITDRKRVESCLLKSLDKVWVHFSFHSLSELPLDSLSCPGSSMSYKEGGRHMPLVSFAQGPLPGPRPWHQDNLLCWAGGAKGARHDLQVPWGSQDREVALRLGHWHQPFPQLLRPSFFSG